ncbi:hypothetical protein BH10PSE14_BH10PSE14_00240 [soil metagenome]
MTGTTRQGHIIMTRSILVGIASFALTGLLIVGQFAGIGAFG